MISGAVWRSRLQASPFIILTRHFFRRLFINDLISFEEEMERKIVAALSILAVLYGWFGYELIAKYQFSPDQGTSWVEKCYYLYMVTAIIGLVTVIEWDVIFPDRRDYLNLRPLPVKQSTLVGSKLMSLFLFVGLFTLATVPFSVYWFFTVLTYWHSPSVVYGLRFVVAHSLSCLGGGLFIFFFIAALIGLLTIVLGRRLFDLLSPYVRGLLLTALSVQVMIFFVQSASSHDLLASFPAWKESGSIMLYLFPPMWFAGLYESILGTKDPVFRTLAGMGALSIGVLTLLSLGIVSLRYTTFARSSEESKRGRHFRRGAVFMSDIFSSLFLRNPVERAVYGFYGKTLKKSGPHRSRIIFYVSVSLGMVLILVAWASPRIHIHALPEKTLLSLPFLLSFFLLAGLRSATELPSSPQANWIFELTEIEDRGRYPVGLKKGVLFRSLVPLALVACVSFGVLWDWRESFFFSLFFLLTACLLMEVFFFDYRKIPFACNSLPGKTKLYVYWWAYAMVFIAYINLPPLLALELRKGARGYFVFYALALAALASFELVGKRLSQKATIIYEEEPDPVLITLDPNQ